MDLSTRYLGLDLINPFMPGASPIVDDLDQVKRYEDAGAAAIVMYSLFEEQILEDQRATHAAYDDHTEAFGEALSFFPAPEDYRLGPDAYLDRIRAIKQAVDIPVIGSLNGVSLGGWLEHAKLIQEAGADALELNVYALSADPSETAATIEDRTIEMVRHVKAASTIPVAVKLSPFYTSLAHVAARLDDAGADGLILFNRFYQPDINIEELEVERSLRLSTPSELLLRLRWLAILEGRVGASLAVSGGVHTVSDAVKAIMAGADAVQMVSALLKHGPNALDAIHRSLAFWLEEHEYDSLSQMKGSMSLLKSPDPKAFERANYVHILQSWEPPIPEHATR